MHLTIHADCELSIISPRKFSKSQDRLIVVDDQIVAVLSEDCQDSAALLSMLPGILHSIVKSE